MVPRIGLEAAGAAIAQSQTSVGHVLNMYQTLAEPADLAQSAYFRINNLRTAIFGPEFESHPRNLWPSHALDHALSRKQLADYANGNVCCAAVSESAVERNFALQRDFYVTRYRESCVFRRSVGT